MIVEIEVPMLGKRYDFQMEDGVPLYEIREEIADLICRKEQCGMTGNEKDLLLWNKENGKPLRMDQTAGENGLETGSRILLL